MAGALRIPLDGSPVAALRLEVEEGDNAPLPVQRVSGLVRVPRVVFKATAGRYQLLLGNPDAAPPRYDLAALRREVLSYSAIGLEAGETEDNAVQAPQPLGTAGHACRPACCSGAPWSRRSSRCCSSPPVSSASRRSDPREC